MAKPIGMGKINMYCEMLDDKFKPMEQCCEIAESENTDEVEKQVKIDIGVYDLFAEREAILIRKKEIDNKLEKYEGSYRYTGLIGKEVERRLSQISPLQKLKREKENLKNRIKLAGVQDDITALFDEVGDILSKYTECLPASIAKAIEE